MTVRQSLAELRDLVKWQRVDRDDLNLKELSEMRLVAMGSDAATVQLTEAELIILNNALNEVCNGIEVPEFATRIGAEKSEVSQLLKQIHEIIDQEPR